MHLHFREDGTNLSRRGLCNNVSRSHNHHIHSYRTRNCLNHVEKTTQEQNRYQARHPSRRRRVRCDWCTLRIPSVPCC
ncbi:hypothetical protein F441_01705 [Phytophthora nicotianae CJ01A1]|uniref:Uncharacterized protein n=1 Tax=Phytophthora nicotianae CJ01A1 TaxID=1317063 RepID=W2XTV0_PHYNI|nr:hypothetical protein F441_01705 [Phytophthora nicotianae CJ01A1]